MDPLADIPLIETVRERCRVCYTCVRECPAKAIRIKSGQAAVIEERCIGCGNCIRVCSQRAKQFRRCTQKVHNLVEVRGKVAVCLAPTFPAEFSGIPPQRVVGMLRKLGFSSVHEVSFGADLVADRYRKLLERGDGKRWLATACPAVFGYVERYHPALLETLAPIVSPMVAMARCLKRIYGSDLAVVFIGPCIAKKREALSEIVSGDVDSALTFIELREMLAEKGITPESVTPSEFDPPIAGKGTIFPISRGLLEAAGIDQGLACGDVVGAEGCNGMLDAIEELEQGALNVKLLEVLACRGCAMGPGLSTRAPLFTRQGAIAKYARDRMDHLDVGKWRADLERFADLDLGRTFKAHDQRLKDPTPEELSEIMVRMGKLDEGDELNCGACGYETCRAHGKAIHAGLAEQEMCLPYTIDQLRRVVSDLAVSNTQLASTQEALMSAEKLASMGQLAASIAHEVNNPLGVVLMYAHLLLDEAAPNSPALADLTMIAEQADRCKRIVAGLLNFSRQNKLILLPVDLRELVERSVRALVPPENVKLKTEHGKATSAELDRDQITQVLTNLIKNAYDAMPSGGSLTVKTGGDEERVWFKVTDTGVGIPQQNMTKLFDPFFTTKPMGRGTGLGLSVSYGIVKMHRGDIKVESNVDSAKGPVGTTFTVTLPRIEQM